MPVINAVQGNFKMKRANTTVRIVALGNSKMKWAKTTVRDAAPGNSKVPRVNPHVQTALQAMNTTPRKPGVSTATQGSLMVSLGRYVRIVPPENTKMKWAKTTVSNVLSGNSKTNPAKRRVQTALQAMNTIMPEPPVPAATQGSITMTPEGNVRPAQVANSKTNPAK